MKKEISALFIGGSSEITRASAVSLSRLDQDRYFVELDIATTRQPSADEAIQEATYHQMDQDYLISGIFPEISPNVVVYVAGSNVNGMVKDQQIINFEEITQINYLGAVRSVKMYLPHMLSAGWGRFIFIGSILGKEISQGCAPYAASKAALHHFTACLGKELGATGVTANCIAPGYCDFGLARDVPDKVLDFVSKTRGRLCSAEDISNALLYLLSNEYIQGETLFVDGGFV